MSLSVRSDMELSDRPYQYQLIALIAFALAPHVVVFPWWVVAMCVSALVYKSLHLKFDLRLPSKWMVYAVGFIYSLAIFSHYRTVFGAEAATPLIALLTSLKLLETNRDRDVRFVVVAGLFLIMTHLLVDQSLVSTIYMAVGLGAAVFLLMQVQQSDRSINWKIARRVARDLVLTLPLWGLLFFAFPRFSIGFSRSTQTRAKVGFSGGIGGVQMDQLVESKQPVFRARFFDENGLPKQVGTSDLYWRGATLLQGQGLNWEPSSMGTSRLLESGESAKSAIEQGGLKGRHYSLRFFENQAESVLFTLGRAVTVHTEDRPVRLKSLTDSTLRSLSRLSSQIEYVIQSEPNESAIVQELDDAELLQTRARVEQLSPALQKLVFELSRKRIQPNLISTLETIEEFFRTGGFRYTLKFKGPAPKSVTDFLLRNRQGFCEHYAAAAAVLLRELGFATRVVVGYHGGKWNPFTESILVRERDAHAWVEVYSGKRWIRFDPTASVSPLRISAGADIYDLDEDELFLLSQQSEESRAQNLSSSGILGQIELAWDYAQFGWERFLLGYDKSQQRRWLEEFVLSLLDLQLGRKATLFGLFSIGIVLLALFIAFGTIAVRKRFNERDLVVQFQLMKQVLSESGVVIGVQMGPHTIAQMVPSEAARQVLFELSDFYFSGEADELSTKRRKARERELACRLSQARQELLSQGRASST